MDQLENAKEKFFKLPFFFLMLPLPAPVSAGPVDATGDVPHRLVCSELERNRKY